MLDVAVEEMTLSDLLYQIADLICWPGSDEWETTIAILTVIDTLKRSVGKENDLGKNSLKDLREYKVMYSPSTVIAGPRDTRNIACFPGNASSVFAKQTVIHMLGKVLLLLLSSRVLKV